MTIIAVILSAVIGALSGVGSVLLAQKFDDNGIGSSSKQPTTQKVEEITLDVEDVDVTVVEAVAQKVTPSVVGIRTTVSALGYFGTSQQTSGEGSGVIYTDDGYIITNYHVISSAVEQAEGSIQVLTATPMLSSGRSISETSPTRSKALRIRVNILPSPRRAL